MKLKKYKEVKKLSDICETELQIGDVFMDKKRGESQSFFVFGGHSDKCEKGLFGIWFAVYKEGLEYNYDIVDIGDINYYKRICNLNFQMQAAEFKFVFKDYIEEGL